MWSKTVILFVIIGARRKQALFIINVENFWFKESKLFLLCNKTVNRTSPPEVFLGKLFWQVFLKISCIFSEHLFLRTPLEEVKLFARCSLIFARCSLVFARCSLVLACCLLVFSRPLLLFAHCSLLLARPLLAFARPSFLFARCSLVFACCSLLLTRCLLRFTRCSLDFARSSLLFACYVLLVTRQETLKDFLFLFLSKNKQNCSQY